MFGIGANYFGQKPVAVKAAQTVKPQFKGHFYFQKPALYQPLPNHDELIRTVETVVGEDSKPKRRIITVGDAVEDTTRSSKIPDDALSFLVVSVPDEQDAPVKASLVQLLGEAEYGYSQTEKELTQQLVARRNAFTEARGNAKSKALS